jgi:hypothetical protein
MALTAVFDEKVQGAAARGEVPVHPTTSVDQAMEKCTEGEGGRASV